MYHQVPDVCHPELSQVCERMYLQCNIISSSLYSGFKGTCERSFRMYIRSAFENFFRICFPGAIRRFLRFCSGGTNGRLLSFLIQRLQICTGGMLSNQSLLCAQECIKDLEKLLEREPGDKAVASLLSTARKAQKIQDKKDKTLFSKMFSTGLIAWSSMCWMMTCLHQQKKECDDWKRLHSSSIRRKHFSKSVQGNRCSFSSEGQNLRDCIRLWDWTLPLLCFLQEQLRIVVKKLLRHHSAQWCYVVESQPVAFRTWSWNESEFE